MAISKQREKLFRDPVHDLISFDLLDPGEVLLLRLIDTPEFQRLRRIRQLGMASMAYPGAEHTRYSHSLGSAHLARRMLQELGKYIALDPEECFVCLCAALLHDLGHGPLSHIIERFLNIPHEERTIEIILSEESAVNAVLRSHSASLPERVASLIHHDGTGNLYQSVISSQLDADRMDYLLRDSLMTGVKYGVYDLERILKMLRVDETGQRIVLDQKSLMAVEKYLQSRYHMYRQVYFHKTVTAAEAMLSALLRRASALAMRGVLPEATEDGLLAKLLLRPRALTLSQYIDFDDATLMSWIKMWRTSEDSILADLATRLLERRLFKTIDLSWFESAVDERLERGKQLIASAGLDPAYYFLRVESSDTPYSPYDPQRQTGGGPILIQDPVTGGVIDVEVLSPTINAFSHHSYTLTRIAFPDAVGEHALRPQMQLLF